jgi:fructose-1,6-bisphosphatase/inositol monophosphatase family enzyme
MPKPVAINPKIAFLRKTLTKARTSLIRGLGVMGRVQVNPSTAAAEVAKLEQELANLVHTALSSTGIPFALAPAHGSPLPLTTGWLYTPLHGRRNAEHGLPWCAVVMGYIQEGRMATAGILSADMDDPCLVSIGEGATCGDRLRASPRALTDAIVMLPTTSADSLRLNLMKYAESQPFHTRKSGAPVLDALMVARGQADAMVATKVGALEALVVDLLLRESAATAKTLPDDTLIGGTPKIVTELTALLAKVG